MATRGRIAIKNSDGTFTSIYTHWDSYPSFSGKILLEHYTDESKVRSLIALGDLSTLGASLGEKHDWEKHDLDSNTCLAYGRDRGQQNVESCTSKDHAELLTLAENCGAEFLYLFQDGRWSFKRVHHGRANAFSDLTQEACKD